jgi:hypothetical protein
MRIESDTNSCTSRTGLDDLFVHSFPCCLELILDDLFDGSIFAASEGIHELSFSLNG